MFTTLMVLLLGSTTISGTAHAAKTHSIDCLSKNLSPDRKVFCSHVIDPMKAKRGELYVLDCTKELGDGYELGICKTADAVEQANLRPDSLRSVR